MKKQSRLLLIILSLMLLASSCGKQGATGPAGPKGIIGTIGPAGANGTVIYSGTSDPASTVGVTGDFYINLTSGMLFGPKTSSGWGTGISLIGPAGATGAAGSQIYSGSGAPSASLGNDGDYYLDSTDYLLYGPKTAAGWGVPLNLQGPAGSGSVQTEIVTITNSQWLNNGLYDFHNATNLTEQYFTRYADNSISALTQDIITNGEVLVYFNPDEFDYTNQWVPLPFEYTDTDTGTFNYELVYQTDVGNIRLDYFFVPLTPTATLPDLTTYDIPTYEFKFVLVTGTALTMIKQNHININDYHAVSKITGIWQQDKPGNSKW